MELHTVCIVSQQRFTGELLAAYLRRECSLPCSVCATIPDDAPPELGTQSRPWLLLCDGESHVYEELLREMGAAKTRLTPPPILAIYGLDPDFNLEPEALELGVRGFFYSGEDPRNLKKAVSALFQGEVWLTRDRMVRCLLDTKPNRNNRAALLITVRETEILELLRDGAGNYEIAERLNISHHTVKTHVYRIFKKIGVSNRWEAGTWAAKNL